MTVAALTPARETYDRRQSMTRRTHQARRRHRLGFTLIETSLATIIVGVGVLAMVAAQQAFHQKNSWSTHVSTATWLGNEIREMTWNLPRHDPVTGDTMWGPEPNEAWLGDFDDLDDFDGWIFTADSNPVSGPINARREIITNMNGWSQTVRVFQVDPFNIVGNPTDPLQYLILIEVSVQYQGPNDATPDEITRVSWIAPN